MCRDYRRRQAYADYERALSETKIRIVTPPRHMAPNLESKDDIKAMPSTRSLQLLTGLSALAR